VDRRCEPRTSTYQSVRLIVLGRNAISFPANLIQLSGHGLRLVVPEGVAVNSLVRVEAADWIAFGEVCYSVPEMSHFAVGLELDQAIIDLRDLDDLKLSPVDTDYVASR
jgi:hypothetical protein